MFRNRMFQHCKHTLGPWLGSVDRWNKSVSREARVYAARAPLVNIHYLRIKYLVRIAVSGAE